ncbi:MAG: glycosyltransferase [Azonexus sp.]|nr:glycosyltransferase [Azonexus sp.]
MKAVILAGRPGTPISEEAHLKNELTDRDRTRMHDFTIFITSYNYGHYIGNAIDSVITQTHPDWNLFILDNGSTDNTFEVIEPYLADPRIRLIKRPSNVGHTMNIALGYIELEGKFISTLQADDWLEPTFVETARKAFAEHPNIPLVAFGWMAYIEPSDTFIYPNTIPYPRSFSGVTSLSPLLTVGNFIPLHMIAFRKQEIATIFQEMVKTPLRQLAEQFIIKRLEDRNGPSYFSAEVAGYWRRHDTQLTNINSLNHISSIENIVEPLIYNQTKDRYNRNTRFLSLTYFVSSSAKIPYRSAAEWLVSENGQHLAEQYGIAINDNAKRYHCLACALMMSHSSLASSELISSDEIQIWITDLSKDYGIEQGEILSIANQAYGGDLFPNGIEQLISENIGKSPTPLQNSSKSSLSSVAYAQWERMRELLPEDGKIIGNTLQIFQGNQPRFHLLIRLQPSSDALLADTLDSLSQNVFKNWHLDIISTSPSPDGLEELPCIDWHTLGGTPTNEKGFADHLVATRLCDWIIELPAGARLDILYLWRLAMESQANPESRAFFVDDDCINESGLHHSPRFKPGVNPEALLSADLAGPLCLRQDTWAKIGGASQGVGSPWFSQLLCIADRFGWNSIKHVQDILISYLDEFPSSNKSCLNALLNQLQQKEIKAEIVPATGKSWRIRYPLETTPTVSIAVISTGQLDLLTRCVDSIIEKTQYPDYELIVALMDAEDEPDLNAWLAKLQQRGCPKVRVAWSSSTSSYANRCNIAMTTSSNEFVLLIREDAVIIQPSWLSEMVRTVLQPNIAGVSPRLICPGTSSIHYAGNILGLKGIIGSPYQNKAKLSDHGYLDYIQIARDVSTLSDACALMRKADYIAVGGMDETDLGDYFSCADLCLKIINQGRRLIYQPFATAAYGGPATINIDNDVIKKTERMVAEARATESFLLRWKQSAVVDPFWNPNLSLDNLVPTPETDYRGQWQYLPSTSPRILARPLTNGQGVFRITSPLRALRKASLATECIWPQEGAREPSVAEILRLAPDILIVQHYLHERHLEALMAWHAAPGRPFTIYTIDDLLTNMDENNPFRKHIPANSRSRLRFAMERCDRMVASTEFLAETYRHFAEDIRVVPNRLEQDIWLPLQSMKRTTSRPRIGWAGGSTHQGDLILLKEIIEATRDEADWIFFGMCPDEIRPLLTEYHAMADFSSYPAKLAALNLDIAVAPLAQTPFNQGKSNLRLLEYGILGIPVICTDIDPYRNSPACRVTNTSVAWTEALRERIYDADAREHEGAAMRKWVQQHYLLENHLEEWLRAHLPS